MHDCSEGSSLHGLLRFARRARVALTIGIYIVLSPFGYVSFALLYLIGTRDPIGRARRLQRVTVGAYRLMHDWLWLTRIVRFNHRSTLQQVPHDPCVVVANHPTLMDVTAITAALGRGCTIAKPALYRRPMLRPLLAAAGHIEGPGDNPVAIGRVIDEAVERLRNGFSLIIFPEGTRSPPGGLHAFGRTAFEIACRAAVPVVSVAVRCKPIFLSKEVAMFRAPHPVPVLQLNALATDHPARVDCDSRALQCVIEDRFREWMAEV